MGHEDLFRGPDVIAAQSTGLLSDPVRHAFTSSYSEGAFPRAQRRFSRAPRPIGNGSRRMSSGHQSQG